MGGLSIDRPNDSRILIYTGGTVTRAVHATGKTPGITGPERNPRLTTQVAAASLFAGTDTFAQAGGADADANADLSVFSGIDPTTGLPWADHKMRPGPYNAVLQGMHFLTQAAGTVVFKTFGSANADAKTILTLTQTAAAAAQTGYVPGEYIRFGDNGIFIAGGFWFTTTGTINDFMLFYDVVRIGS